MSTGTPTLEALKERAKVIRSFMKEKYGVDVSHSHCVEMASKVFGFKDWNTASAMLKPNEKKKPITGQVRTVGQMRAALESFDDSAIIDGMYEVTYQQLMDTVSELELEDALPEDTISQEFWLSLEHIDEGPAEPRIVSFKLSLEEETFGFTL